MGERDDRPPASRASGKGDLASLSLGADGMRLVRLRVAPGFEPVRPWPSTMSKSAASARGNSGRSAIVGFAAASTSPHARTIIGQCMVKSFTMIASE